MKDPKEVSQSELATLVASMQEIIADRESDSLYKIAKIEEIMSMFELEPTIFNYCMICKRNDGTHNYSCLSWENKD